VKLLRAKALCDGPRALSEREVEVAFCDQRCSKEIGLSLVEQVVPSVPRFIVSSTYAYSGSFDSPIPFA